MELIVTAAEGDDDYLLPGVNNNMMDGNKYTVKIKSNPDAATITFGTLNSSDVFDGWADGAITTDAVINCGKSARNAVNINGMGVLNSIIIEYYPG